MSKCWVVCCNDSIEAVITESEEEAEKAKERLRGIHREYMGDLITPEKYKERFYWHIHEKNIYKKAEEINANSK